jgi:hypothetical protein
MCTQQCKQDKSCRHAVQQLLCLFRNDAYDDASIWIFQATIKCFEEYYTYIQYVRFSVARVTRVTWLTCDRLGEMEWNIYIMIFFFFLSRQSRPKGRWQRCVADIWRVANFRPTMHLMNVVRPSLSSARTRAWIWRRGQNRGKHSSLI